MWSFLFPLAVAAPNVVLISLDTTRADALSCYGVPPGPYRVETRTTPNLDALAAEGARFERFFVHAPSTLSSHASLFTGLDPHEHAVVRNGFPLDPSLPTLAERLAGRGWDTVAVLGSSALEQAMGLDRGFRVYDDEVPTLKGLMYQAPAEDVVRRTLLAVDARPEPAAPLFLFTHFYDPHAPYNPPDVWAARFADPSHTGTVPLEGEGFRDFMTLVRTGRAAPSDLAYVANRYLAEVAYVDDQVGRLLTGLRTRGLLENTLVVVVADHGETLAESAQYAWSHGSNVAIEVMHVPLIVRGYGLPIAERAVIHRQAAMDGLAPTIEVLVGLEPTLGDGLSFADLLRAGPVRDEDGWPEHPTIPVFLEATRPRQSDDPAHWNNSRLFRGVWAGGWGASTAPFIREPYRFFDHGGLPDPEVLALLASLVAGWDAKAPGHVQGSTAPTTTRALKSLGYVE